MNHHSWLEKNTVYVTLHGSNAYGLANDLSDIDVKGICIPPPEVEYNLFNRIDQQDNAPFLEDKLGYLKNPKNPKFESTIYTLRKFFILASDVNPNIIELLFTDPKDHYIFHPIMREVMENREIFISNKAKYTFAGYAIAQAKKIERHRKWIVLGEVKPPKREDFNLPAIPARGTDEVFGHIKSKVEQWNLNQYPLDEMQRAELKDTIWDILSTMTKKEISIANWPDEYAKGIIFKLHDEFNINTEVIAHINAERAYSKAKQVYDSWISWKAERNPARRELEEKSGYDTKHASHLVRLMRMGYEIITEGKVMVNRPDADELLAIKNGAWSFDKVMEFKEDMEKKLSAAYDAHKELIAKGLPTKIPREVDKQKINELYHKLYNKYWASEYEKTK